MASGQSVVGTGRPGSIGVHVLPGLSLVVIDGFLIRGFDIAILAESPVLVVNSEILRYLHAGIVLRAAGSTVSFCSFLDQRFDGELGAAVITRGVAAHVEANLFHIEGPNRYFGIGETGQAWTGSKNIGIAQVPFGQTNATMLGNDVLSLATGLSAATLGSVVTDSPGFASTVEAKENLLLLSSSPAIRAIRKATLPSGLGERFDDETTMPQVDRRDNRRAVDFLTAGAHESSFALSHEGKVRMLELLGGLSSKPFDHAAAGANGVFHRLPLSRQNSTATLVANPLDIQPSTELAVLSFSDSLIGTSSAYFKPEKDLKIPLRPAAPPSRRSNLDGVSAISFMSWAKAESGNAAVQAHRSGRGVAQDRPVFEVSQVFQGAIAPNLSLKLKSGDLAAIDVTFVAQDAELQSLIEGWIDADLWYFTGWSFSGTRAVVYVGSESDQFLKAFPAQPFVLDTLNEVMVASVGFDTLAGGHQVVDANEQPTYLGCAADGTSGWHGFLDDVRIDVGVALERDEFLAEFLSREAFNDVARITRKIPKTDLFIAKPTDFLLKAPSTPAGALAPAEAFFTSTKRVITDGQDFLVAGTRREGPQEGVYRVSASGVTTVIENIPEVRDIAIDGDGYLVIVADDVPVSRIDFTEGVRRTVVLDDPATYAYRSVAVNQDNDLILGDYTAGVGSRLVVMRPPRDIASTDPASTEEISLDEAVLNEPGSIAVTERNEIFVLDVDPDEPKVTKVGTVRVFQRRFALGVDVSIAAGTTLSLSGVDLNAIGVLPNDRVAFIAVDADLETAEGESVSSSGSAVIADNAGEFVIRTVDGEDLTFDRAFVLETPSAGFQFELRIFRRNSTVAVVQDGAPLVGPTTITHDPGNPAFPILVCDPSATRSVADPAVGVIFAIGDEGEFEERWTRATLGFDLSEMTAIATRVNLNEEPSVVASPLRSRLVWHMELDASQRGRIVNAAFPGLSDLELPLISLYELLLVQPAQVEVVEDGDDAVLVFRTTFGRDPRLEDEHLDRDYENLSELGIMTGDGVVLLGRQTIARMPYDPLSSTLTRWVQKLRISR